MRAGVVAPFAAAAKWPAGWAAFPTHDESFPLLGWLWLAAVPVFCLYRCTAFAGMQGFAWPHKKSADSQMKVRKTCAGKLHHVAHEGGMSHPRPLLEEFIIDSARTCLLKACLRNGKEGLAWEACGAVPLFGDAPGLNFFPGSPGSHTHPRQNCPLLKLHHRFNQCVYSASPSHCLIN